MIITNPYKYSTYERIETNGKRHYINKSIQNPLPSVTTILDATSDKSALDEWRDRIGHDEAHAITKQSADTGSDLHLNLEDYILKGSFNRGSFIAKAMTKAIINRGLSKVDEVWGCEVGLHYPGLYAGTADLVGVWSGKPAIMDFKNSRAVKEREWIESYFLQLCAYSMAHNELYGTDISTGVIMMATHDGKYLEFVLELCEFQKYMDKWITALELYYTLDK